MVIVSPLPTSLYTPLKGCIQRVCVPLYKGYAHVGIWGWRGWSPHPSPLLHHPLKGIDGVSTGCSVRTRIPRCPDIRISCYPAIPCIHLIHYISYHVYYIYMVMVIVSPLPTPLYTPLKGVYTEGMCTPTWASPCGVVWDEGNGVPILLLFSTST